MATLSGAVRWRDTGKPVPNADVVIRLGARERARALTDAEGRFKIERLRDRTDYELRVVALGSEPFTTTVTVSTRPSLFVLIPLEPAVVSVTTVPVPQPPPTSPGAPMTAPIPPGAATTTATLPPPAGQGTPPEFDALTATVASDPRFDLNAPVNIAEAQEARRLYTVGNYVLARIPAAIASLNQALNTSTPVGGTNGQTTLPLTNKTQLVATHQATIDGILELASDNTRTEADLLSAVRAQFDLGTAAVSSVNTAFRASFREFVGLCANDLLAVDPNVVRTSSPPWDPQKIEELFNFLKRVKRSLIRLVETMSVAGTLGSRSLIAKWSTVLKRSIDVVNDVGQNYVGDDDADRRHIWSVVAELNRVSKASIDPYIVHAREGGDLLDDAISVYDQLRSRTGLTKEDQGHLRELFFDAAIYNIAGAPVSDRLRRNALLIQEHWIPSWT